MPTHTFKCKNCLDEENNEFVFDVYIPLYTTIDSKVFSDTSQTTCPQCSTITKIKVFGSVAIAQGRTLSEKQFGTTKQRSETSKYLREERRKRKKEAAPNTREHDSNELWTGSEVKRKVIDGPSKKTP